MLLVTLKKKAFWKSVDFHTMTFFGFRSLAFVCTTAIYMQFYVIKIQGGTVGVFSAIEMTPPPNMLHIWGGDVFFFLGDCIFILQT